MRAIESQKIERPLKNILEFGANRGLNVKAFKNLFPSARITAVEINKIAADELCKLDCQVINDSIFNFHSTELFELVVVCGVLIHLAPEKLHSVYQIIGNASSKYVLISEYFNPSPVSIEYRGHHDKLFKRDFAGEFLEANTEFQLVDNGFHYSHGSYRGSNQNWFLLKRTSVI